jgi:hypothetical protein
MKRLQDALRFTFTSYTVILIKLNYQVSRQLCNYNGANSSLQIKSTQLGLEPATSRTLGQRVNHYSTDIGYLLVSWVKTKQMKINYKRTDIMPQQADKLTKVIGTKGNWNER